MSERIFKVQNPPMKGEDVEAFQKLLNAQMRTWNVDHRLKEDGVYGGTTRALAASVCHGLGYNASEEMAKGITPELRTKIRNKRQTKEQKESFDDRAKWRKAFRDRFERRDVCSPISIILEDSWGYHPGVHDGIDLICKPKAPLLAICKARVIRADNGGWWGKAPSGDVSKGDGIIILQSKTTVGPFKTGLNFCYGHAESVRVKEGEIVEAGEVIGLAGLAVAWHIHFMVNDNNDDRGVGDRDPRPYLNYARRND